MDFLKELLCPQLGLAVGSQGQMDGREENGALFPCVLVVCWQSFSTEGVSFCQLHTTLPLDSAVWDQCGSIALL